MQYLNGEIIRTEAPFDTRAYIPVKQKPERVALLLDEERFRKNGGQAIHHTTVFILDRMHDWDYCEKRNAIRVYGSIDKDNPTDIVVAYRIRDSYSARKNVRKSK